MNTGTKAQELLPHLLDVQRLKHQVVMLQVERENLQARNADLERQLASQATTLRNSERRVIQLRQQNRVLAESFEKVLRSVEKRPEVRHLVTTARYNLAAARRA